MANTTYQISDDKASGCWRATCKPGFIWFEGIHEFVEWYHEPGQWRKEALADIKRRVDDDGGPILCTTPNCEWCEEE